MVYSCKNITGDFGFKYCVFVIVGFNVCSNKVDPLPRHPRFRDTHVMFILSDSSFPGIIKDVQWL